MTERDLQQAVLDLCGFLGLKAYHTHDSRRSQPGFPDLAIVGLRVMFRELKSETGRLTRDQQSWLLALRGADADADVWRPADLTSGLIEHQLKHLRGAVA